MLLRESESLNDRCDTIMDTFEKASERIEAIK